MTNILRKNQIKAIDSSVSNNFESGVHFHATGSGKSWIAMTLIQLFNRQYPASNIMWICEKKSILIEQFNSTNIKDRNFTDILKKFHILNYTEIKQKDWFNSVNTAKFWSKPVLLIINRAFLTSNDKYKKIKLNFHLIIHDECHSITNKTTQMFYSHILNNLIIPKCIGFSATPNLEFEPFKKIISTYSIYDAFLDEVIVPPKIKWFTSNDSLSQTDILLSIKEIINDEQIHYKKIIVWCGMIELCISMAKLWQFYFPDYLICIDTSDENNTEIKNYKGYSHFENAHSCAILFCACKHREGSDIKNLDCCVFLDKVENRCSKVFVQCIGRVLRIDKERKKKFGLIIDVKAKSSFTICSNINSYLNIEDDVFPWQYDYDKMITNSKLIKINSLTMVNPQKHDQEKSQEQNQNTIDFYEISDLVKLFIREVPDKPEYLERLNYELKMIYEKKLISHLLQAIEILQITKNIPHVTRGSCGSSLICYLLGISHIDPVKYNIKFARFLNEYRNNLPDIDLDFPHNLRDEVFLKIELKWPGKIARISNHVYYHDKSALRQAIRNAGIHKFIGKNDIEKEIAKLPRETQRFIREEKIKLENTFRCYSLHCGGIVYYPTGVPKELLLNENGKKDKILYQVSLNKIDIAKDKNFKIDILSSRAISQLYEINKYKSINFEEFTFDKKTSDMLAAGDNIGIILAESPLMRKALMKIKPKSVYDMAVCLSIIRPAAKDARSVESSENFDEHIIFDDDAIDIISRDFNVSDADADKYRRAFAKGDKEGIDDFKKIISHLNRNEQKEILKKLSNLSRYGFCKSHAFSYAQLVWKLAYMKANYPKEFWKATLNNCESSYKKWVHLYEAKLNGVDLSIEKLNKDDVSIYALNRRKKIHNYDLYQQLKNYGYWQMNTTDFFPDCYYYIKDDLYYFRGIIASLRMKNNPNPKEKSKYAMIYLGVGPNQYIQINIDKIKYIDVKIIGVMGFGKPISDLDKLCDIINTENFTFY
jgi:superfamily II DNA or RNA helicase